MFTGIVERLGTVRGWDGPLLTVDAPGWPAGGRALAVGSSVALNGCCLTVCRSAPGWWSAEVVGETIARSTLGDLRSGEAVNLELPVPVAGRLDGHIVQGHVDAVATVVRPAPELAIRLPGDLAPYVVEKGSIALDGCSLTVARADGPDVQVAIIPHTAKATTLGRRRGGDRLNVEVDVLAKYVEGILAPYLEGLPGPAAAKATGAPRW